MKPLDTLKAMHGNSLLLWEKGEKYNLFKKYLVENEVGEYYEPEGDNFEDVLMNLMIKSITTDHRLIVNSDEIIKYPLKRINDTSNHSKAKLLNIIGFINILWIAQIQTEFEDPLGIAAWLRRDDRINCGYPLIYNSNIILKIIENNEHEEFDIVLIKHPEIRMLKKWTANKDFEEVE